MNREIEPGNGLPFLYVKINEQVIYRIVRKESRDTKEGWRAWKEEGEGGGREVKEGGEGRAEENEGCDWREGTKGREGRREDKNGKDGRGGEEELGRREGRGKREGGGKEGRKTREKRQGGKKKGIRGSSWESERGNWKRGEGGQRRW